ncbi:unnamed protein product [Cylindrotheca closterium]|uniref:Orc1-like AAA ATPase domain-containing protein n=1 Tax=Cylindrotheca closterium TaxID=2856 RepID=A0AAD2G0T8_9STRA|nr:unnamed protein product [Cylindrotheca closterium]
MMKQAPSESSASSRRQTIRRFDIKTTSRGLFGRENEVLTLRSCYERMMSAHNDQSDGVTLDYYAKLAADSFVTSTVPKELVYIIGTSGVGKSSLAFSIKGDVEASENGLFVEGKFDLLQSNEPYTGIAKAFGMICLELLSSSKESVISVGKMLATELQDEVQTLLPLIPELKAIVDEHTSKAASRSKVSIQMGNITEHCQERWKHAFRLLSRALNAAFSPIVLMLDDLQWADESSLEVIDYLVSDLQNPNRLMILGCYRSEEVFDRRILLDSISKLKEKQTKYAFKVTEMKLNPCELDHVNKLIMALMTIEDEKQTQDLAKIVYKRTLGNPFFVLQFMSLLESEALLRYDESGTKWSWDVNEIKQRTNFISDVVELLQGRMKKLTKDIQLLLQYAACLGTSFKLSTIDIIWKEHGTNRSDLSTLIEVMQYEQLIEDHGEQGHKWIHDKVQEAAISLSDKVNESFKFQIGRTLVSALDEDQLEEELFDVVDLLNQGNVATRPELAALNLRAAEKARSISAFRSAVQYTEHGISMLPRDCWTSHREMTLNLFTLGAEMELALGNSTTAERYCDAVFQRNDCSVMEKFPARLALIKKLSGGDADMKRKGMYMCLEALEELGHPLVWRKGTVPLQAVTSLVRTVKATKKWLAKKDKDSLPAEMTDPRHLAIMQLLVRIGYIAYHIEQIFFLVIANCQLVKMTISHGECDCSALGLNSIGGLASIILKHDFSFAVTCAETALMMQENSDSQYEGQTMWTCYLFCLCWTKNLSDSVIALQRGYKVSMRHGDIETAMWILACYQVCIPYIMGQPLGKLVQQCPQLVVHIEEYQKEQAVFVKMFHQGFVNLQSESIEGTEVKGSVFNSEKDQVNTPLLLGIKHFLEGDMIFYSSMEMAAERAVRDGNKFQKILPGVFMGTHEMFHRGVALYAMARKRKSRRYKSRAITIRKSVKQWIKDGIPYIAHYDLLLDAEHAALSRKKYNEADQLYEKAIESAVQIGHVQHSALCSERYADFLLHCGSSNSTNKGAMHQLSESIRYYEEWGAMGKASELRLLIKS